MPHQCKIIADSIGPQNARLTTFQIRYWRSMLPEMNTHRSFSRNTSSCLTGDTLIYVEQPSHIKKNQKCIHKYKLEYIVNKWFNGDARSRSMQTRLKQLNLRCLNEDNGIFITSKLINCFKQGIQDVYEIELSNGYKLKCTENHKLFTEKGWTTLKDQHLTFNNGITSWAGNFPKIATNGFQLSVEFIIEQRDLGKSLKEICKEFDLPYKSVCYFCEKNKFIHNKNLDLIFRDYYLEGNDPSKFMDTHSELKLTCDDISKPKTPGNTLVVRYYSIKNIKYIGKQETYDLEVEGPYHNFIADGFVVHNSRAKPVKTIIKEIQADPFIPIYWGKNQKGMQANIELNEEEILLAKNEWLEACQDAINRAERLIEIGAHKQITNRILEPFMWVDQIITSTSFSNFFAQRCHKDAQPEIRYVADMMKEEFKKSFPISKDVDEWHLPYLLEEEKNLNIDIKKAICTARCARVSYKNFDGKVDIDKDLELHDSLIRNGHFSPLEHIAQALPINVRYGNFLGWKQHRKEIPDETINDYDFSSNHDIIKNLIV